MEALSSAQGGRWLEPSAVAAEGHFGSGAHYHHTPQTASVEVGTQRHVCVCGWAPSHTKTCCCGVRHAGSIAGSASPCPSIPLASHSTGLPPGLFCR